MWTWLRYQAVAMPSDRDILSDLGVGDEVKDTATVNRYKRLHREFPNVKLGPNEDISNHFKRLEQAKSESIDRNSLDVEEAKQRIQERDSRLPENVELRTEPRKPKFWAGEPGPQQDLGPARHSDLPARDPGWWTSPWSESRGYGAPPMPQRTPGDTLRPTHGPGYAPEPLSMMDWVQRMRDKGITLNHSLEVPNAARPGDMPPRPHGRDLMEEFSRPRVDPFGRRRASTTVTSYIEGVLVGLGEKLPKIASLEDKMGELGWSYHRSGSGNWFQHPNIDGNVHILEHQPDGGWIHNYGPTEDEMGEHPIGYPSLKEALLHIHGDSQHGHIQVPYKPRPQLPTSRMN